MAKKNWRSSRAFRCFALMVIVGCDITALIWAFSSVSAGRYGVAVVALLTTVGMLGLTIALVLQFFGLVDRSARNIDGGTEIEPDRLQTELMRVVLVCMGVASALLVFLAFSGNLPVLADRIDERAQAKAVGAAIAVLVISVCTARRWFLRNGPLGYLRLSPRGFEFSSGGRAKYFHWSELSDLTDEATGRYRIPDVAHFHTRDGSVGWIAARSYTVDPASLNRLIRYYWEHPERRDELANGRAAQRWLNGVPGAQPAPKPGKPKAQPSLPKS